MDLGLSEEQEMLKRSARDFLQNECPKQLVRQLDDSDTGYSLELWRKMAELGWMGLVFPEKYGGSGGRTQLVKIDSSVRLSCRRSPRRGFRTMM